VLNKLSATSTIQTPKLIIGFVPQNTRSDRPGSLKTPKQAKSQLAKTVETTAITLAPAHLQRNVRKVLQWLAKYLGVCYSSFRQQLTGNEKILT
jgi:hypothetical protein